MEEWCDGIAPNTFVVVDPMVRPDFVVSGDRLIRSSPLAGGGESLVLPCPLQPGTYSYRIDLTEAGSGEEVVGRELDAVRSLPASLEVE